MHYMLYHYDYFFSICCPTTNPNLFFFFKVGIFLVFLLANAAKIKSQQVQGDENSGGAETGHTLQPYLGKINLKKLFCCLVILSLCVLMSSSDSFTNLETTSLRTEFVYLFLCKYYKCICKQQLSIFQIHCVEIIVKSSDKQIRNFSFAFGSKWIFIEESKQVTKCQYIYYFLHQKDIFLTTRLALRCP